MNTRIPWHRLAAGLVAVLLLVVAAVPLLARSVHAQAEPSLEVVSPAPGEQVTTDDIEVTVKVTNFSVDCAQSGRPDTGALGTSTP